ncbi:rhamnogalacturonyl hydrolase YesR [Mariniluteicoccus endophyticus]
MSEDVGLDPTVSEAAEPPRTPTPALSTADLVDAGDRVARRAEAMRLHRWFWGEGVVLHGLLDWADANGRPEPASVGEFLANARAVGVRPDHVNSLAPGGAAVRLDHADLVRILDAWLDGADVTRAPNGAVEHWPGGVWADTVHMMGLFLLAKARRFVDPEPARTIARQWLAHADILQHPDSGLMAHGSHHGETIWCFWGRANAWLALSATDILEVARDLGDPELDELADQVRVRLRRQLRSLVAVQPDHGVWDVLVDSHPEVRGILETSAAAGIAAALWRARRLGVGDDGHDRAADLAMRAVHAYTEQDGTLALTSAGTILQLIPFGYAVIRSDRIQPWGQGLALRAYAEAVRARREESDRTDDHHQE